jgi:TRAP-type C4-dicarboxylate transport system permease small subunit
MSAATVLEDGSLLSRSDRFFFRIESLLNLASGVAIFLLVMMATVNILGRWLFSSPISGYVDWVEQAMPFIALLGIAYTQRVGGHIRMDIVVGQLKGRWLWFTELLTTFAMLILTLALIYGSYLHFWRSYTIGDSSLDINLPTWPAKLVVSFSLAILALRLVLHLWGYARALRKGGDQPVAVPLIESPRTVAVKEAQAVTGEQDDEGTSK